MKLYKGKPSKIVPVIAAGEAFEHAVFAKPPSAGSRKMLMSKLLVLTESDESESTSVDKIAEIAIDLILMTSCDDCGVPNFEKADREFISEKLELYHHDKMVIAGCEMVGNIPDQVQEAMLMDMLKGDEDVKEDDNEENDDEKEADESEKGKPETE